MQESLQILTHYLRDRDVRRGFFTGVVLTLAFLSPACGPSFDDMPAERVPAKTLPRL